jgi:trypsin-like peptidase
MNSIVKITVIVISVFSLLTSGVYAGEIRLSSKDPIMMSPVRDLKKTIIFLGKIGSDGRPVIAATGVLVNVDNIYHLITAKHVIINPLTGKRQDNDLLAFFNLKEGGVTIRPISEVSRHFGVDWIFHDDPKVDIAIIPFLLDPASDDVLVVGEELFLGEDELFELYEIFFLSYQPGIEPKGKISPVVRSGAVSLLNEDGTFYIDAFAFPGNTGSPVFLKPSPIRFDKDAFTIGSDPLGGRFIGIIGEYVTYQELAVSAQSGRPRIVFEENTGLSKV